MNGMMIFFDRKEAYEQWNPVAQSKEYNYIFTILVDRSNRIVEFEIAAYQEDSGAITYRKVMAIGESATFTAAEAGEWTKEILVDSIQYLKITEMEYVGYGVDPLVWAIREKVGAIVRFFPKAC